MDEARVGVPLGEHGGDEGDGVVARGLELVEIEEVELLLAHSTTGATRARGDDVPPFSAGELAYAHARSDPARRLAARLAAKRAAASALGPGLAPSDIAVHRESYGAPVLRFSPGAQARLQALGASRTLVSLTHERTHAAAVVLLLSGKP